MAQANAQEALQHGMDSCEQVAKAVEGISVAAKKLLEGPLTPAAACLLIREAMPRGTKSHVTVDDVYAVLLGAANMKIHLKGTR